MQIQAFGQTAGVTRIEIELQGPGIESADPDSRAVLVSDGGEWWGTLQAIPPGPDRLVIARGLDSDDRDIVHGQTAVGETITGDNGVVRVRLERESRSAGAVIYVSNDASGTVPPDGRSWQSAFPTLQEAMDVAESGQQVWVKRGRYVASSPDLPVLRLKEGVDVFGSFEGTETEVYARPVLLPDDDPTTILDGDLNENGRIDDDDSAVVVFAASIVNAHVDRLLVQGARESGMMNLTSSPQLSQIVFRGNGNLDFGGGMNSQWGAAPVLNKVRFERNRAIQGGGLYNGFDSAIVLNEVRFENNFATQGAGLVNDESVVEMNGGGFFDNIASEGPESVGGGMANADGSVVVLNDVRFENNEAGQGAGMNNEDSTVEMRGGGFFGNVTSFGDSTGIGGGMASHLGSTVVLDEVRFENNKASQGAGMVTDDSMVEMNGGTFSRNIAVVHPSTGDTNGGGMSSGSGSTIVLNGVRFDSNEAAEGAGVANFGATFEMNGGGFFQNIARTDVEELVGVAGGMGNFAGARAMLNEVQFVSNEANTGAGMASFGSTVEMNGGGFSGNVAHTSGELGGVGGGVANGLGSMLVVDNVRFENNGATEGAGMAIEQSTVELTGGGFFGNRARSEDGARLAIGGGITIRPGSALVLSEVRFENNEANQGAGMSVLESTLEMSGGGFFHNTASTDDSGRPGIGGGVASGPSSRLVFDDVRFENNAATEGAGMSTQRSTVELTGGGFFGNNARSEDGAHAAVGGGVRAALRSALVLSDVRFENNEANEGAGMNALESTVEMTGGGFFHNTAHTDDSGQFGLGGGMMCHVGSTVALTDVTLEGNEAVGGAGVAAFTSTIALVNSLLLDNSAEAGGGAALIAAGAQATVVNATVTGNRSPGGGGGIQSLDAETATTIVNSVFWNNRVGSQVSDVAGAANVSYSCSEQTLAGSRTLDSDPFERGPHGEFFLQQDSATNPCVDAGNDAEAGAAGLLWCASTTALSGELPDVSPVDAGVHYALAPPVDPPILECPAE